jgi:hypothetical protein
MGEKMGKKGYPTSPKAPRPMMLIVWKSSMHSFLWGASPLMVVFAMAEVTPFL